MKRLLTVTALLALAVPAAFAAPPPGKGNQNQNQHPRQNPAKACMAERGTTPQSIAAFKESYGTNPNKQNAFGKCVAKLAKQMP